MNICLSLRFIYCLLDLESKCYLLRAVQYSVNDLVFIFVNSVNSVALETLIAYVIERITVENIECNYCIWFFFHCVDVKIFILIWHYLGVIVGLTDVSVPNENHFFTRLNSGKSVTNDKDTKFYTDK